MEGGGRKDEEFDESRSSVTLEVNSESGRIARNGRGRGGKWDDGFDDVDADAEYAAAIFDAAADVSTTSADADGGDRAACGDEREVPSQDREGGGGPQIRGRLNHRSRGGFFLHSL